MLIGYRKYDDLIKMFSCISWRVLNRIIKRVIGEKEFSFILLMWIKNFSKNTHLTQNSRIILKSIAQITINRNCK